MQRKQTKRIDLRALIAAGALIAVAVVLCLIVYFINQIPTAQEAFMADHPYTFAAAKALGTETRDSYVYEDGCVYVSYPTTGNKDTDQKFQELLQTAKEQFDAHLEESADAEDERIAHLIFDYTARKDDGFSAITCFYEISRRGEDGQNEIVQRKERTYLLDAKSFILDLNGAICDNATQKLDLMLRGDQLSTADIEDFSIEGDNLTLRWAGEKKTFSVQAVKRASLIDPEKPMIALTFDDGPGKYSRQFADLLEKYNGHATFFVLGANVSSFDQSLKYVYDKGNEIASHTHNHKNLNKHTAETVRSEIEKADQAIYDAIGAYPTLIRAPYGNANGSVLKIGNRPFIKWNLDTEDWKSRNAQAVKNMILNYVADGDIILMHEIYESTYDGLALALEELSKQGYQFVTVSELMHYRGVKPEVNTYFSFPPKE